MTLRGRLLQALNDTPQPPPCAPLSELEWWHIVRTLLAAECNISKAAKLLKINRRTIYRKLQERGLAAPDIHRARAHG